VKEFKISWRQQWRLRWDGSIFFRITLTLTLATLVVLSTWGTGLVYIESANLQEAFQDRGVAVSRTFATIGAAAIFDNLFRIQEAMLGYQQDPDLRYLEVVDEDNMIMASMNPQRIGMVMEEQAWIVAKQKQQELVYMKEDSEFGSLLMVSNASPED